VEKVDETASWVERSGFKDVGKEEPGGVRPNIATWGRVELTFRGEGAKKGLAFLKLLSRDIRVGNSGGPKNYFSLSGPVSTSGDSKKLR